MKEGGPRSGSGVGNLESDTRFPRRIVWLRVQGARRLATENLVRGSSVYGEKSVSVSSREYRIWDPFRSKLAASILRGLKLIPIGEGSRVLYLGASTGTTASHISDIIGEEGTLYAVEVSPRVARDFIDNVASKRRNTVPIVADARMPHLYGSVPERVDTVYCDIAQPDQTKIAIENCRTHLKHGGYLILIVKSRSIDVTKSPKSIFREEAERLRSDGFVVIQVLNLEPFDKDHALILASFSNRN